MSEGAPLITHGNNICTLYNPSIWSRSKNLGLFECYLTDVVVNAIVAQAFYFSSIAAKYDGGEITQEPFSGIRQAHNTVPFEIISLFAKWKKTAYILH